jgi:GNAT superfamily N-acetyltransferase
MGAPGGAEYCTGTVADHDLRDFQALVVGGDVTAADRIVVLTAGRRNACRPRSGWSGRRRVLRVRRIGELLVAPEPFGSPDATRLIAEVQAEYLIRYGGMDETPVDPDEFAAPYGAFLVARVDGVAVGCAGWRDHDDPEDEGLGQEVAGRDAMPAAGHGRVAELKRMFVSADQRGRGIGRALLVAIERSARAASRRRMILETGDRQPEAIMLYLSCGYLPSHPFGHYRSAPGSRHFGKDL